MINVAIFLFLHRPEMDQDKLLMNIPDNTFVSGCLRTKTLDLATVFYQATAVKQVQHCSELYSVL